MERLLYVRARLFEDQVLPALPLNTMPRATRHGCVGIRGSFYCPMLLESPPHGALPFSARATGKHPRYMSHLSSQEWWKDGLT